MPLRKNVGSALYKEGQSSTLKDPSTFRKGITSSPKHDRIKFMSISHCGLWCCKECSKYVGFFFFYTTLLIYDLHAMIHPVQPHNLIYNSKFIAAQHSPAVLEHFRHPRKFSSIPLQSILFLPQPTTYLLTQMVERILNMTSLEISIKLPFVSLNCDSIFKCVFYLCSNVYLWSLLAIPSFLSAGKYSVNNESIISKFSTCGLFLPSITSHSK